MFEEVGALLEGQEVALMLKAGTVEEFLPAGTKLAAAVLRDLDLTEVDLKTLRVAIAFCQKYPEDPRRWRAVQTIAPKSIMA